MTLAAGIRIRLTAKQPHRAPRCGRWCGQSAIYKIRLWDICSSSLGMFPEHSYLACNNTVHTQLCSSWPFPLFGPESETVFSSLCHPAQFWLYSDNILIHALSSLSFVIMSLSRRPTWLQAWNLPFLMLQSQLWSNDQALLEAYPDSKTVIVSDNRQTGSTRCLQPTNPKAYNLKEKSRDCPISDMTIWTQFVQHNSEKTSLRRGNRFKSSHVYQHYFDSFSLVFLKNGRGGISCP